MRAYQAMLYGEESFDAKTKEHWKRLLLQYRELDTMAMVVIFEHWWRGAVRKQAALLTNRVGKTPTD